MPQTSNAFLEYFNMATAPAAFSQRPCPGRRLESLELVRFTPTRLREAVMFRATTPDSRHLDGWTQRLALRSRVVQALRCVHLMKRT
jgi:hypothetical protein